MSKQARPDLTFPQIPYGSHQVQHDLQLLLYRGASSVHLSKVGALLADGCLGHPIMQRLPLVTKLHDAISGSIAMGKSRSTALNRIKALRIFYAWADANRRDLTVESALDDFIAWGNSLWHRVHIAKDMNQMYAYRLANAASSPLKTALDIRLSPIRQTMLEAVPVKKKVLSTKADKQNLAETFEFGHALFDITQALTVEAIRGPLPIEIELRIGKKALVWCGLKPSKEIKGLHFSAPLSRLVKALDARSPLKDTASIRCRYPAINLRVDAELLMFIAQTGMNLTQAYKLKRGSFRYRSEGENFLVYRAYKRRMGGESEFRIFREYRSLFQKYIEWLDAIIPEEEDQRLFPYMYSGKIPSFATAPGFKSIRHHCKELNIKCVRPMELRSTRVNWVLRRSRDPEITAQMAQHSKETLLRIYERPHHQTAAREISRFHALNDSSRAPPGPGTCVGQNPQTTSPTRFPPAYPTPDCISPSGCLFCQFHRDMDTQDYVWSLTSFSYYKCLELSRFRPIQEEVSPHPAVAVIERIDAKLASFREASSLRSAWVDEARDRVREGRFHPAWDGFIQLLEAK
ncbi:hypothetical protein ABE493_08225 [Stenotrophomonas terrae]|uniref:hypothetical protein n=1 Tax=Stenotrophomonas terrae TaxID=405446 RepID=UPI003207F1C6